MDVTASAQLTRDGWLSLLPLISELFLSYPNLLALVGYSGFYRTRAERNPALKPGKTSHADAKSTQSSYKALG